MTFKITHLIKVSIQDIHRSVNLIARPITLWMLISHHKLGRCASRLQLLSQPVAARAGDLIGGEASLSHGFFRGRRVFHVFASGRGSSRRLPSGSVGSVRNGPPPACPKAGAGRSEVACGTARIICAGNGDSRWPTSLTCTPVRWSRTSAISACDTSTRATSARGGRMWPRTSPSAIQRPA